MQTSNNHGMSDVGAAWSPLETIAAESSASGTSQSHGVPGRKSDLHVEETSILGKARAETCLERLFRYLACFAAGRSLEQRMDTVQSKRTTVGKECAA